MNFEDEETGWGSGEGSDSELLGQSEHDWDESLQREVVSLDELERDWAEQLRDAALVVQVDYRDSDAVSALKRLGYFFQTKQTERVTRNYPAAFLVGLNLIASSKMEKGTLWPFIFEGLNNLKQSQPLQETISRLHRMSLNKFQLQRFEHPLGRIGEILLHAGIPISSQEKFIRRLIKEFKAKADFDSASFNASIREISGDRVQASAIDKQIWHFINQAGAVADDFVAKCIEILDEPDSPVSGAGLPARVITEVQRLVVELGKSNLKRAGNLGQRIKPPRIVWSTSGENELKVMFPSLPESKLSAVRWSVELSDETTTIDVAQELAGISVQERSFEVRKPVAQVNVRSESLGVSDALQTRSWTLTLFPEDNPVMFFDSDGELESGKGPLDPSVVRVLLPSKTVLGHGTPVVSVDGNHSLRAIDAPLGWGVADAESVWFAQEIDLTVAEAIELSFGANGKSFRRAVSAFKRPKPSLNGLVQGVFDQEGLPVFSEFPEVEVGSLSTAEDQWTYEIRNDDRVLVWQVKASPKDGRVSISSPPGLRGRFHFQISRGFGQSVSLIRTVLPGLQSNYEGDERAMRVEGLGLDPFDISLSSSEAGEIGISLNSRERSKVIHETKISSEPLIIRPDYEFLELFNTRSRKHTQWIEPTRSNVENLTELELFFSSQKAKTVALVARWPSGETQVLQSRVSAPWFKFNLGELSDAAASRGAFDLELRDQTGRDLKAGKCYPRKLFRDFVVSPSFDTLELTFQGGVPPIGLQLAFFTPKAPWRRPVVVDLDSTHLEIPEAIRNFGLIAVTVAVSSPWAPHDFGTSPEFDSDNTFQFEVFSPDKNLDPEQALTHWLITGEESDLLRKMDVALAWTCFTRAAEMPRRQGLDPSALKELAATIIRSDPHSLAAYEAASRNRIDSTLDLIDSGLVAQLPASTQLEAAQNLSRPVLACLGIAQNDLEATQKLLDLASGAWGASLPSEDEDDAVVPLRMHSMKLGLLDYKSQSIKTLIRFDEALFSEFASSYLPGRLLDGGNIFLNVFSPLGFDVERLIVGLGTDWTMEVCDSVTKLDDVLPKQISELLKVRPVLKSEELKQIPGLPSRTANWPAISIRMAFAARLAARGYNDAKEIWESNKGFYLKMAKALPALAEIDLTLAELALRESESEQ